MRLLIAFISVVAFVGCNHEDRITRLEKEIQQLKEQIAKQQATADYDLQEKCAKDSRTWFNENWQADKTTLLLTYTNHYNKKSSKCFIEIEYHYQLSKDSWTNDVQVWDIYENVKYGGVSVMHTSYLIKAEYKNVETVLSCEIYGQKCKTFDEYNNLARPYMSD